MDKAANADTQINPELEAVRHAGRRLYAGMTEAKAKVRANAIMRGKRLRDLNPKNYGIVLLEMRVALAMHLASIGPIFPVIAETKRPAIAAWPTQATRDPRIIRDWAMRFPNCNWGIVLNVVDVDAVIKPGNKQSGTDTFSELTLEYGEPDTYRVMTPTGGEHIYITEALPTAENTIGEGIDSRGSGKGYVVAAGSHVTKNEQENIKATGFYMAANDSPIKSVDWIAARVDDYRPTAERGDVIEEPEPLISCELLAEALAALDVKQFRDQTKWLDLMFSCHHATAGQGFPEFQSWSLSDTGYTGNVSNIEQRWNSCKIRTKGDKTLESPGGLVDCLRAAGQDDMAAKVIGESNLADDPLPPPTPEEEQAQDDIRVQNEKTRPEPKPKGRPQVVVQKSYLPRALAHVERVLLAEAKENRNVPDRIFHRDGRLVRLNRNLLPEGIKQDRQGREANALLIVPVRPKWLANRLDRSIQFMGAPAGNPTKMAADKKDGKKQDRVKAVPKDASAELVARMLEDDTQWKHPDLFGIVETPTLRADGSLLQEPGYDEASGLYFDPGTTEFPKIKDKPTKAEGAAALARLADLLTDFPFIDAEGYEGVSRSVALAAILTGPVRRCISIAPGFAVTANEAESGKTELQRVTAGLLLGRELPGQPLSDSEEERRKCLGALLREGRQVQCFDNVDNTIIEGDFLERMLTLPTVTDRILTTSETYTAPTNVLLLFNGNKITVAGAMTTRILLSRIVPDKPLAERRFKYPDLFGYVLEQRPNLVADVLTALRAWLVSGTPDPERDTSRFPQWDRMIAQCLVWYGYADPVRGGDELREVDPTKEAQREVIRAWGLRFGTRQVGAAELWGDCTVRRAIATARDVDDRNINPKHVARYVAGMEDVRLGLDWKLHRVVAARTKTAQWWLEWTGEGPAPDPEAGDSEEDFGPG